MSALQAVGRAFAAAWYRTRAAGRLLVGASHLEPDYSGIGRGRRSAAWNATEASISSILSRSGRALVAKSRDVIRRNPWAKRAMQAYVSNTVGGGIRPQPLVTDPEVRRQMLAVWDRWVAEADADGTSDFYGLQAVAARAVFAGGDCFARFRSRNAGDGLAVPVQVQLLEAEQLPHDYNTVHTNGNAVRSGIEFDLLGRRAGYHFYRVHPGDVVQLIFVRTQALEIVRVPAEQVLHLFRVERPGQIRGEPELAAALSRLKELDDYEDAEAVRKKIAAMYAAFVTKQDLSSAPLNEVASPIDKGVGDATLEPGTTQYLLPGEDVKFSQPADVGPNFDAYAKHQLRSGAAAAGVMYEQATGDYRGATYTSTRTGLLEVRRGFTAFQRHVLMHQFCEPVWRRVMRDAVLSGALRVDDFLTREEEYLRVKWIGEGWDWVDPLREVEAMTRAVRAGLMSRSEAVREWGGDAEQLDEEIAADNERADEKGLVLDSDARHRTQSGGPTDPTGGLLTEGTTNGNEQQA